MAVTAFERDVAAVGIDVEERRRVKPKLVPKICTPAEQAWLDRLTEAEAAEMATLLFATKEAVYKCTYGRGGARLAWHDVEARVLPEPGRLAISIGAGIDPEWRLLTGRFRLEGDHVVVLVWRSGSGIV